MSPAKTTLRIAEEHNGAGAYAEEELPPSVPMPPRIPDSWPVDQAEWLEYEQSKLRMSAAIQVALLHVRQEGANTGEAIKISLQSLHNEVKVLDTRIETLAGRVDWVAEQVEWVHGNAKGMDGKLDDVLSRIAAVQESVGASAEQVGVLASDVFGQSKDTQREIESLSSEDDDQDRRIMNANIDAAKARLEAERATLQADAAKVEAAIAKAQSEKSAAEAAIAKSEASSATKAAANAKEMATYKVATLLAAGPVAYTVFKVVYEILQRFEHLP